MSKQRIRGESFKQEYQSGTRLARGANRRRDPSMNKTDPRLVIAPQSAEYNGKLVLVLDLDETLVYARTGPLYARPGISDFFQMCKNEGIEVVVWTAGLRAYAQAIVGNIDKNGTVAHCIYRHNKWFDGRPGYRKDLNALGRTLDRVLIIENTPDCIRGYQDNGILVRDYEGGEGPDNTLYVLAEVVRNMCNSGMVVSQYLASCNLVSREDVPTDVGDRIPAFVLKTDVDIDVGKERINRDLEKNAKK